MTSHGDLALENALDLRELITKGSILQLNDIYCEEHEEISTNDHRHYEPFGYRVESFQELKKDMVNVDPDGLVKKKRINTGGGDELGDQFTVSIVFSGYCENEQEPFVFVEHNKPMSVNLIESGLLPGLLTGIKSMLVGESSVFLLSYKVAYGDLGVPPKIKPKADCIFFVKLIKATFTPKAGQLNLSEPNTFNRVFKETKSMLQTAKWLYKTKNYNAALSMLRKGVNMLHRTRLADESEETLQEKLLIKFYINQAVVCNANRMPLKACIACNELKRLTNINSNSKILYQNAKALRMIGAFDDAEFKLKKALKLNPGQKDLLAEYEMLKAIKDTYYTTQKTIDDYIKISKGTVSEGFKKEINHLVEKFKEDPNLCELTLPSGLSAAEVEYVNTVCERNKLFCNKAESVCKLDKQNITLDAEDYTDGFD